MVGNRLLTRWSATNRPRCDRRYGQNDPTTNDGMVMSTAHIVVRGQGGAEPLTDGLGTSVRRAGHSATPPVANRAIAAMAISAAVSHPRIFAVLPLT